MLRCRRPEGCLVLKGKVILFRTSGANKIMYVAREISDAWLGVFCGIL